LLSGDVPVDLPTVADHARRMPRSPNAPRRTCSSEVGVPNGDDRAAAGKRFGRINHPVPAVRPRNPQGRPLHQCRREHEPPGSAGQSRLAATSPTNKSHSKASTWRWWAWTPPARVANPGWPA